MAIVMSPLMPSMSQISGYTLLAEVRAGGNGDYAGTPEFDIGSGSNNFSTGRMTWTGDLTNGFDSGSRLVRFDAMLGGSNPNSTLDVQNSMTGLLTHTVQMDHTILAVQFRVGVQGYRMEMKWQNLSVQFLKNNVVTETVPLPGTMDANSLDPSSSGVAEQLCTVLPTASDNTEAIVTGSVRLTSMETGALPFANALFGQVFVYATNPASPPPPKTTFYLKKDPDGLNADLWINSPTPGVGAPTQIFSLGGSGSLNILGGAEDDVLTVDFSNGNPVPAGGFSFNGGAGDNTTAVVGTTADDTLTLGSGGFTFANSAFGTVPINAVNVQNVQFNGGSGGSDSINVAAGIYNINADTPSGTPAVSVAVQNAAQATFPGTQHLKSLTVDAGSTAAFTGPGASSTVGVINAPGTVLAGSGASVTVLNASTFGTLDINGKVILDQTNRWQLNTIGVLSIVGGILDLKAQELLVTNTAAGTIAAYVLSAYHSSNPGVTPGDWLGSGITSSYAIANASTYGVGSATSADNALTGLGLATGQVMLRPTVLGDANLDGVVDLADLAIVQNNAGSGDRWALGDFNYDQFVDLADLAIVQNHAGYTFPM